MQCLLSRFKFSLESDIFRCGSGPFRCWLRFCLALQLQTRRKLATRLIRFENSLRPSTSAGRRLPWITGLRKWKSPCDFPSNQPEKFWGSRVSFVTPGVPQATANAYRESVLTSFNHCLPLPLSAALGGAIAGRSMAIRFIDHRQKFRQASRIVAAYRSVRLIRGLYRPIRAI
jgi:hypothetical protein